MASPSDQFQDEAADLVLDGEDGLGDFEMGSSKGRKQRKHNLKTATNRLASGRRRQNRWAPCVGMVTLLIAAIFGLFSVYWNPRIDKGTSYEATEGDDAVVPFTEGEAAEPEPEGLPPPVVEGLPPPTEEEQDETEVPFIEQEEEKEGLPPTEEVKQAANSEIEGVIPPEEIEGTEDEYEEMEGLPPPEEEEVEEEEEAAANPPETPETEETETTNTLIGGNNDYAHQHYASQQIENFKNGNGLLLNFILPHHAGTTVRRDFSPALKCPTFVCITPTAEDQVGPDYPTTQPWSYNDTAKNIDIVTQHFRFIMWPVTEPPSASPKYPDMDWENPNLVSMLVIREPLSQSLANDGLIAKKYPTIITVDPVPTATLDEWWAFAKEEPRNDNFALRILSDYDCCDGANTSRVYLEQAKQMVQRFTFILDINCLQHSLTKVAETLGFEAALPSSNDIWYHKHKQTPQERIPFPEIYNYLVEKNKLDIELYEWAKSLAIVNCDQVYEQEAQQHEEEKLQQEQQQQQAEEEAVAAAEAPQEAQPETSGTNIPP